MCPSWERHCFKDGSYDHYQSSTVVATWPTAIAPKFKALGKAREFPPAHVPTSEEWKAELTLTDFPPSLSTDVRNLPPAYIHTYIHTYIGRRVSLVGGQLSVPSRCTAVYTWLITASFASGRGDLALLSWVDPVLGNLGLPVLVGLGSTELAKFDRQASLGTGCCALP